MISNHHIESLADPEREGVAHIKHFMNEYAVEALQQEIDSPDRVPWWSAHAEYENARGLTIKQNYFTYALRTTAGDQAPFKKIPLVVNAMDTVTEAVQALSPQLPILNLWSPDEVSLHEYDQSIGLSFHKDNVRFMGVVAMLSIDGLCDLAVRDEHTSKVTAYRAEPGDLMLLRASGLVDIDLDSRPEHAVMNLQTPTRSSMVLRQNLRPDEAVPGFEFANWPET